MFERKWSSNYLEICDKCQIMTEILNLEKEKMTKKERFPQNDKDPFVALLETYEMLDDYFNDTQYQNVNIMN